MPLFFFVIPGPHSFIDLGLGPFNQISSSDKLDQRPARATMSRDSFCARRMPTTKGGHQQRDFAVILAKLVHIVSVRVSAGLPQRANSGIRRRAVPLSLYLRTRTLIRTHQLV